MSGRRRTAACALMAAVLVVGQMPQARSATVTTLATRLDAIRTQSFMLEGRLLDALKTQSEAKQQIKNIQKLIVLQDEEQRLGTARMVELQATVDELIRRRATLGQMAIQHRRQVREALVDLERGSHVEPDFPYDPA
ncbi:MAG: hypothetical protein AAB425_09845, partial [Bdellovibrionota bacterium]